VLEDRRLLSGGVLDPTFGTGGTLTTLAGTGGPANAVAVYPQAGTANDGKIVVGGLDTLPNDNPEFVVVRYNPAGSLDRSFGGTGEVFGPGGFILDLAIQPDGKILAGGYSGGNFALARYNANGSLDQTFGTRGLATTDIGRRSNDWLEAVGLQADGKIVAA